MEVPLRKIEIQTKLVKDSFFQGFESRIQIWPKIRVRVRIRILLMPFTFRQKIPYACMHVWAEGRTFVYSRRKVAIRRFLGMIFFRKTANFPKIIEEKLRNTAQNIFLWDSRIQRSRIRISNLRIQGSEIRVSQVQ